MNPRPYTPFQETEKRTGDWVYDSIRREFVRFIAPKGKHTRRMKQS